MARLGSVDFYSLLGLERDASGEDISRAFKRLAKLHHPDRNPDDAAAAAARFAAIQEAHECLSVAERRLCFDEARALWLDSQLGWEEVLLRDRQKRMAAESEAEAEAEQNREARRAAQHEAAEAEVLAKAKAKAKRVEAERVAAAEQAAAEGDSLKAKRQRRREAKAKAAAAAAAGPGPSPAVNTPCAEEASQISAPSNGNGDTESGESATSVPQERD